MDCTSTPTVVCELSRVANALADKSPSWFEWLQLAVTVLSLLATVAVGAVAAYIAYRAHRLAKDADRRADLEAERLKRAEFALQLQDAAFGVLAAAASGDAERHANASLLLGKVHMLAASADDPNRVRLANEISKLNTLVQSWDEGEMVQNAGRAAGELMAQAAIWVRDPDLLQSEPAIQYPDSGSSVSD